MSALEKTEDGMPLKNVNIVYVNDPVGMPAGSK